MIAHKKPFTNLHFFQTEFQFQFSAGRLESPTPPSSSCKREQSASALIDDDDEVLHLDRPVKEKIENAVNGEITLPKRRFDCVRLRG
jgi:hypothetical protein